MNAILIDGVARCRVDLRHQNSYIVQDLPDGIMRSWAIADRCVSKEVLEKQWILAQALDGLLYS